MPSSSPHAKELVQRLIFSFLAFEKTRERKVLFAFSISKSQIDQWYDVATDKHNWKSFFALNRLLNRLFKMTKRASMVICVCCAKAISIKWIFRKIFIAACLPRLILWQEKNVVKVFIISFSPLFFYFPATGTEENQVAKWKKDKIFKD